MRGTMHFGRMFGEATTNEVKNYLGEFDVKKADELITHKDGNLNVARGAITAAKIRDMTEDDIKAIAVQGTETAL